MAPDGILRDSRPQNGTLSMPEIPNVPHVLFYEPGHIGDDSEPPHLLGRPPRELSRPRRTPWTVQKLVRPRRAHSGPQPSRATRLPLARAANGRLAGEAGRVPPR